MKYLYLFLILFSTLYAQEVGMPYVNFEKIRTYSNAVLSPDNKTFCIYNKGHLTFWNLNPIKIFKTIIISDPDFSPGAKILFATNDDKIIFASSSRSVIGIYDIRQEKFIKKSICTFNQILSINSQLITIDDRRTIIKWDAVNLNEITRNTINQISLNCDECSDRIESFINNLDQSIVCVIAGSRIIVIDSETLKIKEEMLLDSRRSTVSIDHQIIIGNEKYINLQNQKIGFDLSAWDEKGRYLVDNGFNNKEVFSTNDSLFLTYQNRGLYFYDKKNNSIKAILYYFGNEIWIAMTSDGFFDRAEGSLRYLKKKISSASSFNIPDRYLYSKIISPPVYEPIDDATYQKYHKPIYLNDSIKDK